jgi:hypothetical protein
MRISLLAIAFACAWATPTVAAGNSNDAETSAASAEGQAAPADKHAKKDKDHQVCRMETATGSVMPKRVCHSQAEIQALQAQAAATRESLRH